MNLLSKKQLKLLLLLLSSAAKNNGEGKLERETIDNSADIYFSGDDLFVICRMLKRFGLGSLTCCDNNRKKILPCLGKDWKNLPIGIRFSDFEIGANNGKTQKTNRRNNEQYEV